MVWWICTIEHAFGYQCHIWCPLESTFFSWFRQCQIIMKSLCTSILYCFGAIIHLNDQLRSVYWVIEIERQNRISHNSTDIIGKKSNSWASDCESNLQPCESMQRFANWATKSVAEKLATSLRIMVVASSGKRRYFCYCTSFTTDIMTINIFSNSYILLNHVT